MDHSGLHASIQHCAACSGALNFKDVMLAYGKLATDLMDYGQGVRSHIGLEFSGQVRGLATTCAGAWSCHFSRAMQQMLRAAAAAVLSQGAAGHMRNQPSSCNVERGVVYACMHRTPAAGAA